MQEFVEFPQIPAPPYYRLVWPVWYLIGISQQARSTMAGRAHASSDIAGGRPRAGDGAATSGVHRHVGLLQERPGGIGAATCDIETFPRKCQNQ